MKHESFSDFGQLRGQSVAGTACILLGATILALLFASETSSTIAEHLPRSWYVSRFLWVFLGLCGIIGGGWLVKARPGRIPWRASTPGIRFGRLVLYTRAACPLCDEAHRLLDAYSDYLPVVEEVDVDGNPELLEQFADCVPVVELDGKVRFRGRISESLLRRLIEGTPPLA